ncbi:hypothetical protein IFM89_004379 [Coptis chinensis]|uniref:Kinesin motor domain-containing protein n=1 Tax=Coptis chinensis TaxID=261450 RepID=A0A835IJH8_9MAGN|nr:hypothetical protein IFM89_004379 [Coptis chinensis]
MSSANELFETHPPLSSRSPLSTIPDPSSQNKSNNNDEQEIIIQENNKSRHPTPTNNKSLKPKLLHTTTTRLKGLVKPAPTSEAQLILPCFDLLQDPSFWTDHNVQVLIRIRPINAIEKALQGNVRCLRQESAQTVSWIGHPETRFTFDHIACETISQEKLFTVAGLPMVENCMSGYNSCMFAYGQTGSGKTYTMMGDIYEMDGKFDEDCGMAPRIFEYLFTRIYAEEERDENFRYSCKCSFLEIYNEQITDLLEPSSTNLQIREDLGKGVYVENLSEYEVSTVKDVVQLLLKGAANRKMAATNMNCVSSRSHSVFTCVIESRRDIDSVTHLRFGRLNLVDLAGSERQKSSGAEGERLKEAANINKSLSTLGLVIMTLVDVAQGKQRHVPYRDSRLTFLLQDSLGGNSKTAIIANISPSVCSANETLSTLKFAQRAKLIQNNAKVNEDASGDVMALQRQIQQLKDQLTFLLKHQNTSMSLPIPWPNFEQSQSVDFGETYDSTLERKTSDHCNDTSILKKKMICMKATLSGALRREKMAESAVRRLDAEIEHMNRLVRQREEDAQHTKMILRFREEKIKRLELLADGLVSGDEYLIEENNALLEEIQVLQARIDRSPELTRFALENIRLIEQLRMFQDFYEQGERETLLAEVSELRDQLMETLKRNYGQLKSPSGRVNEKRDKETALEMGDCGRNLDACLENNNNLTAEVDQLWGKLNTYSSCSRADHAEIISLRNESEDEIASYNQEDEVFQIKNYQKMDVALALQLDDRPKVLFDAKALNEAMDYEQIHQVEELDILQKNFECAGLLGKKDTEEMRNSILKLENGCWKTVDPGPSDADLLTNAGGGIKRLSLTGKLEELNRDLKEARILNKRFLDVQASQIFRQNEFKQVCQEVEAETAKTILRLQEELEQLQDKMGSTTEENSRLINDIEAREYEIKMFSEEWEKATLELTSFLLDGSRSLEDASEQIGSIACSFPGRKACICEQVERAAKSYLEKERTIVKLQQSLEGAQKMGMEMKLKLSSLQGATLAITEIQQLENDVNSREAIQWQRLLSEKMAKVEELERKLKNKEDQLIEPGKHAHDIQGRCFEVHNHFRMDHQENFNQLGIQTVDRQLQCSELSLEEVEASCSKTREVLHLKLGEPIFSEEEKTKMANSFFSKFEEAQATIEEADAMLTALLKANENARHVTDRWKEAGEELMMERVGLIEEVQQLKSSLFLKEEGHLSVQAQFESSLAEIALSISSLENSFVQIQRGVEESLKEVYSDISSLVTDLLCFICNSRSSLEDIWSEIVEKEFYLSVVHLCYAGNWLAKISSPKLEKIYSIGNHVGKGYRSARGESSVFGGTEKLGEDQIEMLQNKLSNEFKSSFDMVPKSSEEEMDLNRDPIFSEFFSLKRELVRKDVLLKGLLFDISLLQESTSSSIDIKDEAQQMFAALTLAKHELGVKTKQLNEILVQHRILKAQVADSEAAISISNSKVERANKTIDLLSNKNSDLMSVLEDLYVQKTTIEEELKEEKEVVKGLEKEILSISSSVEDKVLSSVEDIEGELRRVIGERDHLREEVVSLYDRLEMQNALADENEAIAVEARQASESEASKVYAEQKEEEAKILEHSVEELESTINVLEKKVYDMGAEVERHRMMRDNLEMELQALKLRMLTVENSRDILDLECSDIEQNGYEFSRLVTATTLGLEESRKQIRVLEKERAAQATEIKKCREYISELILHAEAQASQYQQKYKTLEAMVREVKTDPSASTSAPLAVDKTDKSLMRARGSNSPFRCIASLVQQMKLEKDQELSVAMLKIEELETLASSQQKEVCMLNARLAAADNMTHDVIRDLLGVKLDMTNYANLIDGNMVQNVLKGAQQQTEELIVKEHEILKLRKKVNDLTEERKSCIEDINQKNADILAAQVTLEQLKQRDQMLTAQNEMLKVDKVNLKRKENGFSRASNEELQKRLTNSEKLLLHVNNELAWYSGSDSTNPNKWEGNGSEPKGRKQKAEFDN